MTSLNELVELLSKNIVEFTFFKKDGSIRKAKGTRSSLVAENNGFEFQEPKKGGAPNPYAFFDLEKNEWRSWSEKYNPEGVEVNNIY